MASDINKINSALNIASFILKYGEDELRNSIRLKLKIKFCSQIEDILTSLVDKSVNIPALIKALHGMVFSVISWDRGSDEPQMDKVIDVYQKKFLALKECLDYTKDKVVIDGIYSVENLLSKLDNIGQEVEDYIADLTTSDWIAPDTEHQYGI